MKSASEIATSKKILIVRLGAMGDIIHALPAALMLRVLHPGCTITWVVEERWVSLLTAQLGFTEKHASPQGIVDHIVVADTKLWRKKWHSWTTMKSIHSLFHELRASSFDLAVDFQGSLKSASIAALSGAREVWGFQSPREKPASLLYTRRVDVRSRHVVDQNFELAAATAGTKPGDSRKPDSTFGFLPHDPAAENDVAGTLNDLGFYARFAILNPGAGWGAKQWPADRYATVAKALGSEGLPCLINFGPAEKKLALQVEQESEGQAIAASFTISQLMAVTRRASLFIGGDTGPMHLAALFHVPVVAIFGPTDPARNGPYGTKSIVLRDPSSITSHKRNRNAETGLLNITTAQVLKAARELLAAKSEGVRE